MAELRQIPSDSDFSLFNIPFGLGLVDQQYRAVTRVGDQLIDLYRCAIAGMFSGLDVEISLFQQASLNQLIRCGKEVTNGIRSRIRTAVEAADQRLIPTLLDLDEVQMVLPIHIGDYTDFYSSREHATNVGTMFRDPNNALLPNWLHLPVGYHGRSSSIVVSGTEIKRPLGQQQLQEGEPPVFGPSRLLDFELEMAFVIGKETNLGEQISINEAEDYIFGLMLFNDWSARDIQKWEYVPLGPFLAKNFASTVSPWIIPLEALEPFRVSGPIQEPAVLPYLQFEGLKNYDIDLEVNIITEQGASKTICRSNFKFMYWNMCQQLAHHTVNGCNVRVGDLLASGTISGPTPDSFGSMLELTWRGTKPIIMPDGTERKFIQNGDTIAMRAVAKKDDIRVGFGPCDGKVVS